MSQDLSPDGRRGGMAATLAWLLWLAVVGVVVAGALISFGVAMWAMEVAIATGRRDEWIGSILLLCLAALGLGLVVYSGIMMRRGRRRRALLVFLPLVALFGLIAFPFLG